MPSSMLTADVSGLSVVGTLDYSPNLGESISAALIQSAPLRRRAPEPQQRRWGMILAGGDGTRLRSLTRMISGDDRPKQFCRLLGGDTLLGQTQLRAARSIPPEKTIVALTNAHEHFFEPDLRNSASRKLIQPSNRGTAPPILLGMLDIARQDSEAIVAVLPSDHYFSNESAFTRSLESAFSIAGNNPEAVVLLGARPHGPEIEFGWIEVGSTVGASHQDVFAVKGFKEKPSLHVAEQLFKSDALWNTFVMVGSVQAFLHLAWRGVPDVVEKLGLFLSRSSDNRHISVPASLYEGIAPTDFSRHVLTAEIERLMVLRLNGIEWHDLGKPDRVISVVHSRSGVIPSWIHRWERAQMLPPFSIPQFE